MSTCAQFGSPLWSMLFMQASQHIISETQGSFMLPAQVQPCSTLSLPKVINFKFPLLPHQQHHIAQFDDLAFHSLLWWRWPHYQFSLTHLYSSLSKVGRMYFLNPEHPPAHTCCVLFCSWNMLGFFQKMGPRGTPPEHHNMPWVISCWIKDGFMCRYQLLYRMRIGRKSSSTSLPLPEYFKFLLQPHQKYNITQYEELAFS